MKTRPFTLKNNFHNSEITLRAKINYDLGYYSLSENQVKKAKESLCGVEGCTCSGEMGVTEEPNDWHLDYDGNTGKCIGATCNTSFAPHYADLP